MSDKYTPQGFQETTQKINKKIWIFVGISGLVVIVLFIVLFMNLFSNTISDDELSAGTPVNLKEKGEVKFEINEEEHKIIIDSVYDDSVDIIIQSEIITANIKIGETKEFDLDDDGIYDIKIKLESIEDGVPYIFIKKISEVICEEDWDCTEWSDCEGEIKTRVCIDSNNCGTEYDKPEEQRGCEFAELNCLEQNGIICKEGEVCNGILIDAFDSDKCCDGTCEVDTEESDYTLKLGINLLKDSYEVGETVEGNFSMSYNGESFEGIVLYTYSRADCPEEYYTRIIGTISTGSFDDGTLSILRASLQAFKLTKVGSYCSYVAGTDYFYEEDSYGYRISVYNCSTVENELGKDCSDVESSEVAGLTPMKSEFKSVVVEGGSYPSECKLNSDCTELCEGCEIGKQICRMPSEVCSDCINYFDCKDGYKCENYECVLE